LRIFVESHHNIDPSSSVLIFIAVHRRLRRYGIRCSGGLEFFNAHIAMRPDHSRNGIIISRIIVLRIAHCPSQRGDERGIAPKIAADPQDRCSNLLIR
jgi:hypothetical protein